MGLDPDVIKISVEKNLILYIVVVGYIKGGVLIMVKTSLTRIILENGMSEVHI